MRQVFLTTRYTDDIYKLIVNLCIKDISLKKKKIKIEEIKIRKIPDFFFLIICLKYFFQGKFWSKKDIVSLKFKDINFGKKLLSITFRNFDSYISYYKYYYNLFKNIYLISKLFSTANFYEKNYNFNYVYIDHLEYLNGIYFEIFKKKNRVFYTNHYPNNIVKTKKKNIETVNTIYFKNKKYSEKKKKVILKTAKKVYGSIKDFLPWMNLTKWSSMNLKNLKDYKYIIYTHSFTDSQLEYGYDGFVNTLEWLEYTIDQLQKKQVKFIIKAHPNFYVNSKKNSKDDLAKWDREIYKNLKEKIKFKKNILFIDKPILNKTLVSRLDKKCLVITKHGSVQLEMIYHGFKVIASEKNLIDKKYKLVNSWNNKEEYKKLINRKWDDLNFGDKNNFLTVIEFLFMNENSILGKKFYLNELKEQMYREKLINRKSTHDITISKFNNLKDKKKLINKINIPIINI